MLPAGWWAQQTGGVITASYGFGEASGETEGTDGSAKPARSEHCGPAGRRQRRFDAWNDADSNTLGAWDFGIDSQIPALNYADYDGPDDDVFDCNQFPVDACGTLLPGQRIVIGDNRPPGHRPPGPGATIILTASIRGLTLESWTWQQRAGVTVSLMGAATATPTFTLPNTRAPLVFKLTATASDGRVFSARITVVAAADADANGLIEIYSLADLHNMRYNLAGTSYETGTVLVGNNSGCPAEGCRGYELMQDLDFDLDGDGRTWSSLGSSDGSGGYTLDPEDNQADYFPVEDSGGGWLPIGSFSDPFVATFDGNGHSIHNLAIRRDETSYIGLFGSIGEDAAIGNLGLIDNLADYTGSSDHNHYIGGLVGRQRAGSITASYATGPADGGAMRNFDYVGGLVGQQSRAVQSRRATPPAPPTAGMAILIMSAGWWDSSPEVQSRRATPPAPPTAGMATRMWSAGWWAGRLAV